MLGLLEGKMPGGIPPELACLVLDALPVDMTFIDKDDVVRYYSGHRIFSRTHKILGTLVQNCHSPASRQAVDKVIDDLKRGRAQVIEQLSKKGGHPVRVLYLAVRDERGEYAGLVEMCQWVKEKKAKPPPKAQPGDI